jgi:hypothetical protein
VATEFQVVDEVDSRTQVAGMDACESIPVSRLGGDHAVAELAHVVGQSPDLRVPFDHVHDTTVGTDV